MPGKWLKIALLVAAGCVAGPSRAASIVVKVLQADGRPLKGAVATARPESSHLHPVAPLRAIVDQINQAFVPDVLVIPVGSTVDFPNTDAVSHQVYSFSSAKRFQLPLYRGNPNPPVHFDTAGVVTLGCNIHDSMVGYVIVTDAPFFGRTDSTGSWHITDLPAGNYHVTIWHPLAREDDAALERTVVLAGDQELESTFRLSHSLRPEPITTRPHSWDKY